ncbi:hypothetical protein PAXRUDRAFT_831827 [Paxillus rubicundulus Ve08.2h10]|uniref:Uncharacterized protein n=1 Tax=Paxillus rubicundulus Ve08.2h10 TaxID=930991 RepID=A0A0D0DTH3_9AGAM|nr:hypothetical protein PAXRUDRAFT_831827 [Paxillus rubicundulus Ve08.2h10]
MSHPVKGLARFSDATLGAFAFVPSSETLDHLIRYLSTWNGTDKLFTLIEYTLKLVAPVLIARAKIQHRVGVRKEVTSSIATSLTSFASLISDFKMLGRFLGLLPIVQWMITMERSPPPTRVLLIIERLQGWSMLAYYPLEHLFYLRAHDLIPAAVPSLVSLVGPSSKRVQLNPNTLAMWSCRAWAVYVILQFAHLMQDRKLLLMREKNLKKCKGVASEDKEDLRKRWGAFWNEVVVNSTNLPLAIHWSLEKGMFTNNIWPTIFGFINGVATFRSGWKATALHASKTSSASIATAGSLGGE